MDNKKKPFTATPDVTQLTRNEFYNHSHFCIDNFLIPEGFKFPIPFYLRRHIRILQSNNSAQVLRAILLRQWLYKNTGYVARDAKLFKYTRKQADQIFRGSLPQYWPDSRIFFLYTCSRFFGKIEWIKNRIRWYVNHRGMKKYIKDSTK